MKRREEPVRSSRKSYTFYPVDSPELALRMESAVSFEGFYTYLLHQDLDHVVPYRLGRDDHGEARMVGRKTPSVRQNWSQVLCLIGTTTRRLTTVFETSSGPRLSTWFSADRLPMKSSTSIKRVLTRMLLPSGSDCTWSSQEHWANAMVGQPIQYVLPTISSLRDTNGLSYVDLDPSALVRFTLPAELAKPAGRLASFLKTANAEQGRELALVEQAMTGSSSFSYDDDQAVRPLCETHRAGGVERPRSV